MEKCLWSAQKVINGNSYCNFSLKMFLTSWQTGANRILIKTEAGSSVTCSLFMIVPLYFPRVSMTVLWGKLLDQILRGPACERAVS